VDNHCSAIGFPLDRVSFVGIDPPFMTSTGGGEGEKKEIMKGVAETADLWTEDPHGTGPVLAGKRARRNPWKVSQALLYSHEEVVRSGLAIRRLEDGSETLIPDAPRPWVYRFHVRRLDGDPLSPDEEPFYLVQ
jgi:hypothetical protein